MEQTQKSLLKAAIAGAVAVCVAAVMMFGAAQPAFANEKGEALKAPTVKITGTDTVKAGTTAGYTVSVTNNGKGLQGVKCTVTWQNRDNKKYMETVVLDKNGKIVKNATVKKSSTTVTTNANGKAKFNLFGLSNGVGKVTVSVKYNNGSKTVTTKSVKNLKSTDTIKVGTAKFKVTAKTAVYYKYAGKKAKATVPATVKIKGKSFKVTKIAPKAFKGTKATQVVVKTKALKKAANVKNCLAGSKVKTVETATAAEKKLFAKKSVVGKKVAVK